MIKVYVDSQVTKIIRTEPPGLEDAFRVLNHYVIAPHVYGGYCGSGGMSDMPNNQIVIKRVKDETKDKTPLL